MEEEITKQDTQCINMCIGQTVSKENDKYKHYIDWKDVTKIKSKTLDNTIDYIIPFSVLLEGRLIRESTWLLSTNDIVQETLKFLKDLREQK